MRKAILFPGKYIQGRGVAGEIGAVIKGFSKKPFLIWGKTARAFTSEQVIASLKKEGLSYAEFLFTGESTKKICADMVEKARSEGCDFVIGLGGGKVLDISKAVAARIGARCMMAPTVAASDAATSAHTVWYTDDSVLDDISSWEFNPDIVLADLDVLIKTPPRMLGAGIGDALATYIEARLCYRKYCVTSSGGSPTLASLALCKLCYDVIMEYAREAVENVKCGVITPGFEKLIEAVILLSGIGWENGGTAIAHQLGIRLTWFNETHHLMHGEEVAFGIITQLCLDHDQDLGEACEIVDLMIDVGLPVTFKEMGLDRVSRERLRSFAERLLETVGNNLNANFIIVPDDIVSAMCAADSLGTRRKALKGVI